MSSKSIWLLSGLATLICASVPTAPAPTEPPSFVNYEPTRTFKNRRDILSDVGVDVHSILGDLGSNIPTYVASGIQPYFQGLPTGTQVQSSLGLSSSDVAALPTQVLNLGPYANWTERGWNVRFHGNVYKQPNISTEKLNSLANDLFIYGTNISSLPPSQQEQARNVTAEIFVIQQGNQQPIFNLEPASSSGASGEPGGGGAITATGGSQRVVFPYNTTSEGDFDAFVPIASNGLLAGNATTVTQRLNVFTQGTTSGNATAYLYPDTGITVVNDIDDILRVTRIYVPAQGLLNTFARPFTPWLNMPEIYANWSKSIPTLNFHYLTTTPEQATRNYEQFIYSTYPGGSFDTRNLNFSDISSTLSIRKYLLVKIFETFPHRKFILVADTSNSDVMRDYPAMATEFPGQVQCIFQRNTSSTDGGDRFPYDTSGFKTLNQQQYMFFNVPDDLKNLDVENGHCYNASVKQNLTYGYQGLPFGLSGNGATSGGGGGLGSCRLAGPFVALAMLAVAMWGLL